MKLKATIISIVSVLIVGLTAILLYCFWPAIKGTVDNSKYYTQEELQESYDKGYEDGCKTETELTGQVKYYKDLVDEYYMQVNTLNDEITMLTNTNRDYATHVSNLESQKTSLQEQVVNLTTIKSNNETTISQLNTQIAELENEIIDLENSCINKENTIAQKNEEITQLKKEIENLEAVNTDNSNLIHSKNNRILALEREVVELEAEITTKNNTISNKNIQITELQDTIVQLQKTNEFNAETITNLSNQIIILNSQISDMTLQIQNNSINVTALNNKIAELEKSVDYYEQYIANLENGEQVVATFEFNGSVYNIQIVNKNSTVSVVNPTSTDYVIFNYWTVNGEQIDLSTYQITSNVKIVANVTLKYDVKFMVDDTEYDSQIVIKNGYATIPANPTKTGYAFDGWTINGVDIVKPNTTSIIENTTYVAKFTKLHNVYFRYENTSISSLTVRNNESVSNIPDFYEFFDYIIKNNVSLVPSIHRDVKEIVFNGWTVNGVIIDVPNYPITASTTFTADITYLYEFKFMVDDTEYHSQLVEYNTFVTLPENPVKDGYNFVGWSLDGVNQINNSERLAVSNKTFIALFEKQTAIISQSILKSTIETSAVTSVVFDYYTDAVNNSYLVDGINIINNVSSINVADSSSSVDINTYHIDNTLYVLSASEIGLGNKSSFNVFKGNTLLTNIDLSNFNTYTSRSFTMAYMFQDCTSLTSVNLSKFNTSNVYDMSNMFYNCSSLITLDLSSFDTSNVSNMTDMFFNCTSLKTIYVGDNWSIAKITNPTQKRMFVNCFNLPDYQEYFWTVAQAHTGTGGYLTYKGN